MGSNEWEGKFVDGTPDSSRLKGRLFCVAAAVFWCASAPFARISQTSTPLGLAIYIGGGLILLALAWRYSRKD